MKKNSFDDGSNSNEMNSSFNIYNINMDANVSRYSTYNNGLDDLNKDSFYNQNDFHLDNGKVEDKVMKNKSVNKLRISSSFVMKWPHTSIKNNSRIRKKKSLNQKLTLIIKNRLKDRIVSIKYKLIKTVGCSRPIFMFINRDSRESATIFRNLRNNELPYLIFEKYCQVSSVV